MSITRKCEVLVKGRWKSMPFNELRRGHVYRLFEENGNEVDDGEICMALSDAYEKDGQWTVRTEPMDMVPNIVKPEFVKDLCIDFDGVVHDYEGGWKGKDVVAGNPVPGAFAWLGELIDHPDFRPLIYSSRSDDENGILAMRDWFQAHGFARVDELGFPTQKPPAWLTIDDRCVCFTGTFPTLAEMADFRPWNR